MIKVQKLKVKSQKFGFTLIELLVVISIIGILATLILARFGTVEKATRDARRKSDLNQYRTSLENYAIKSNGIYPVSAGVQSLITGQTVCDNLVSGNYLSQCPTDPRNGDSSGNYWYRYVTDVTGTKFMIYAYLENSGSTPYLYICSNGKTGSLGSSPVLATHCP